MKILLIIGGGSCYRFLLTRLLYFFSEFGDLFLVYIIFLSTVQNLRHMKNGLLNSACPGKSRADRKDDNPTRSR